MFADLNNEKSYHVSCRPHVVVNPKQVKGSVFTDINDEKLYHVSYKPHVFLNLNR